MIFAGAPPTMKNGPTFTATTATTAPVDPQMVDFSMQNGIGTTPTAGHTNKARSTVALDSLQHRRRVSPYRCRLLGPSGPHPMGTAVLPFVGTLQTFKTILAEI
jgi:hypothetical protein